MALLALAVTAPATMVGTRLACADSSANASHAASDKAASSASGASDTTFPAVKEASPNVFKEPEFPTSPKSGEISGKIDGKEPANVLDLLLRSGYKLVSADALAKNDPAKNDPKKADLSATDPTAVARDAAEKAAKDAADQATAAKAAADQAATTKDAAEKAAKDATDQAIAVKDAAEKASNGAAEQAATAKADADKAVKDAADKAKATKDAADKAAAAKNGSEESKDSSESSVSGATSSLLVLPEVRQVGPFSPSESAAVQTLTLVRLSAPSGDAMSKMVDAQNEKLQTTFLKAMQEFRKKGFVPFATTTSALPVASKTDFGGVKSEVWFYLPSGGKDTPTSAGGGNGLSKLMRRFKVR